MAAQLVEVPDPLAAVLGPGPALPLDRVRRSLAASVAPVESPQRPPPFLRPDQVGPFRRAAAALERHGCVLVADPVGSGKTWIALALAAVAGDAVAIVPAALREQWRRTAARLGIPVAIHSHEALSRGRTPERRPRLIIVDECHRFRTPGTRRYRTLSRWAVGRPVLLLSATPVVNRLVDLAHQLRLGLRDDALAVRGIPDLLRLLERGETSPVLGDVVLCRPRPPDGPRARSGVLPWTADGTDHWLLDRIEHLRLSTRAPTRALIRMALCRALASSRAALAGALTRYGALLDQACAARRAGRVVSREEIRRFTQGMMDQMVFWELMPALSSPADLVPADRAGIDQILERLRQGDADPRAAALAGCLADGRVTLVFTTSRETQTMLRRALAPIRPAWVNGQAAGIGTVRLERELVLACFRPRGTPEPPREGGRGPTVLLATDVAAEGLDLQRAERIVHFDLPWTSVRIDQREGRAVRLGSERTEVDVLRFAPWTALEERLQQEARLLAKRGLAGRAGLDQAGHWLYRWRVELAASAPGAVVGPGIAMVEGDSPGWLVGLALDRVRPDGCRLPEPAALFWIDDGGRVTDDAATVNRMLTAMAGAPGREPTATDRARAARVVRDLARERLNLAGASSWQAREAVAERRRLARGLRHLAREAARARDRRLLDLIDQALDWLAGGVTAGEAALLRELADGRASHLPRAWRPLLERPRDRSIPVPRLTGVIGVCNFRPCQPSAPCCSTSTAR